MSLLWHILQFLSRAALGISLCLRLTSSRQVPAGFFRVHLWVVMGIAVLATLVGYSLDKTSPADTGSVTAQASSSVEGPSSEDPATPKRRSTLATWFAAAVLSSYLGASCWFYYAHRMGRLLTSLTALILAGQVAWTSVGPLDSLNASSWPQLVGSFSAALLLGTTLTAMLLGHWYLNEPGMQLKPLIRLLNLMFLALLLRTLVCGGGVVEAIMSDETLNYRWWIFVVFRWSSGLIAVVVLTIMTRATLRIPNTQSATGILYAATVLVILGELTSQLLSDTSGFHL